MNYKTLNDAVNAKRQEITTIVNRIVMMSDKNVDVSNEWTWVTPSISTIECPLNSDECTVINVRFEEGGYLKSHKHSRQEEIFVVTGEIYDPVNDVRVSQGESYTIPPNKEHALQSDNARIMVVYRPPFHRVRVSQ
jgi:quercetin dioxygenase-like cupin family protein